jgi:TonB family protein
MTNAIGSAVPGLGAGWLAAILRGSGAVSSLGWTLLHFCWQGAGVALALWCALGLLPARWTRARYGAACLALALMVALPVGTFARLAAEVRPVAPEAPLLRMEAVAGPEASGAPVQLPLRERVAEALDAAAPWVPAIWLVGVVLFLGRLKLGLAAARRMRVAGTQAAPKELQSLLRQLAARLQVARAVQLMHTAVVQVPTVIGWLRPVILLPIGCFSGLSQTQIEALLAHELAHIRRHDYLVSVFQSVVEALLFYHPAVWWVSRQVRQERECCCDELAVGVAGDRLAYARALSLLEERRAGSQEMALGANGGVLTMRIRRLLGLRADTVASQAAAWTLLAVVIAVAGSYVVTAARGEAKATQASAPEAAPLVDTIHATAPVGAGVEASSAKPKASRLAELDRKVQAGKETVAFLEGQLRIEKVDDEGQSEETKRLHEQTLQSAINQARHEFQKSYRELVAAGKSQPRPAQVAAANSSDDLGTARSIYKTWLDEDVRWIITDAERAAFLQLANDEERDTFIAHFWARRDPPGTAANTFREQHYKRIAYTNQHFATAAVPGWKSDRGHIYIVYGKPDSIDAHPSGGQYQKPGGQSTTSAYPFEVWHYRSIAGIGEEVDIDFVDTCRCGEYHYTIDRAEKDLLKDGPGAAGVGRERERAKAMQAQEEYRQILKQFPNSPRVPEAAQHLREVQASLDRLALGATVLSAPRAVSYQRQSAPAEASTPSASNGVAMTGGGLISRVEPVYPPGTVFGLDPVNLWVTVSKTGTVSDVEVVSGPPKLLVAAIDAVRQWKYEPVLLNGEPKEAHTVVTFDFEHGGSGGGTKGADKDLYYQAMQAIQEGRYEVARPALQTLIHKYPESALVKSAIAKSWEQEGGGAVTQQAAQEDQKPAIAAKKIGNGVSAPSLIYQVNPEYTPEAKAAKLNGSVTVSLIVDANGDPSEVRVIRGVGMGLDEKAIEAVKQWKFKPGMENGSPVTVAINAEVRFQLF